MELKELRIGNYYHWNAEGKDYLYQVEPRDFVRRDYKHFKPIPLTEDWLIKFGFVKKHFFELSWITGGLQIIESNDYWYPSVYSHPEFSHEDDQCVSLNRIKHVNQLQNLYFALTQKELTF